MMKKNNVILPMLKLVKPLMGSMSIAVFFGTLGHLCAIAIPLLGGFGVLSALSLIEVPLGTIFVVMGVCALFRGMFAYIEQQRNHYIAFKLLALIRDKGFFALRRLCPGKLEGKNKGDLIALITSDIEQIEVFFAHTISPTIIGILVTVIMTVFIGQFSIAMGITAFVGYVLVGGVLPFVMSKTSRKVYSEQKSESANLSDYYLDSLKGKKEILHFNKGEDRKKGIEESTKRLNKMNGVIAKEEGKVASIADTLVYVFTIAILVQGFFLLDNFVAILLTTVAILSSFGPVLALSRLSVGLSAMMASSFRVLSLINEAPVVEDIVQGKEPEFESIKAENLSFGYNQEEILKDFSIDIEKNQIVGIHGKSGSGKSTLLKLMMRFWQSSGITISKADINTITTDHLRDLESYMTQDTDIFSATVLDNIKVGKLQSGIEEVIDATKKAAIYDFIMTLPKGFDTPITKDTISGGQRQRIGLARAFLKNSPLILLDEPTSNLDSLNEGIILKALKGENDKTVILVSHRKSTLGICEKIVHMDKGRIS